MGHLPAALHVSRVWSRYPRPPCSDSLWYGIEKLEKKKTTTLHRATCRFSSRLAPIATSEKSTADGRSVVAPSEQEKDKETCDEDDDVALRQALLAGCFTNVAVLQPDRSYRIISSGQTVQVGHMARQKPRIAFCGLLRIFVLVCMREFRSTLRRASQAAHSARRQCSSTMWSRRPRHIFGRVPSSTWRGCRRSFPDTINASDERSTDGWMDGWIDR